MVIEFLFVLDHLDAEEDAAQNQRQDQEACNSAFLAFLSRPYGHSHGEAAENQHHGVYGTEGEVQHVSANTECRRKRMAVDRVCQEQPAEEKNFGDQKDPHAQRRGFFLLLQRLKLSVQLSGAMHSVLLFSVSTAGFAADNQKAKASIANFLRPNRRRALVPDSSKPYPSIPALDGAQNRRLPIQLPASHGNSRSTAVSRSSIPSLSRARDSSPPVSRT